MFRNQTPRCLLGLFAGLLFSASAASAQDGIPTKTQFMNRYDFHISMRALSSSDRRFGWIGDIRGDMDLIDYVKGRATFLAEYEVVMGDELRPFDPNQGNYTFEGSTSWRLGKTEVAAVFHHLSRHLSDRPKIPAVAMNSIEGRVLRRFQAGKTVIDTSGSLGKVVEHAFLDYSWRAAGNLAATQPLKGPLDWYGRTSLEIFGTDPAIAGRSDAQTNGRIETGLRLNGKRGNVEFYGGWEHRADAHPLERIGRSWAYGGFRLSAR
jgi:hypothetical protein